LLSENGRGDSCTLGEKPRGRQTVVDPPLVTDRNVQIPQGSRTHFRVRFCAADSIGAVLGYTLRPGASAKKNRDDGGDLVMVNKAILLAVALAFALPAFADNPSNSKAPMTNPKGKPKGWIEQDSYSVGATNTITGSKGSGSAAGKTSPGNISLTKPCNKPNPPRSCKQLRPAH
jgi:hypothetical protein